MKLLIMQGLHFGWCSLFPIARSDDVQDICQSTQYAGLPVFQSHAELATSELPTIAGAEDPYNFEMGSKDAGVQDVTATMLLQTGFNSSKRMVDGKLQAHENSTRASFSKHNWPPGVTPTLSVIPVTVLADPHMIVALIVIAILVVAMYKLSKSDLTLEVDGKAEGPRTIIFWCVSALLISALSTAGLVQYFFKMPYVLDISTEITEAGILAYSVWTVLVPAAMILCLTASLAILTNPRILEFFKTSWLVLLAMCWALLMIAGAFLARDTLRCGIVFCSGGQASLTGHNHNIGLWLIFVSASFFVSCLAVLGCPKRLKTSNFADNGLGMEGALLSIPYPALEIRMRRRKACELCSSLCLSLVVLPVLFLLTTLLPNGYEFDPITIAEWMAVETHTAEYATAWAWMKTVNVKLSDTVVLKLFPDTVMFYSFLEMLALSAVAAVMFPSFGRYLKAKRDPIGFSNGEKGAMCLFSILLILWAYYWLINHQYHDGKVQIDTFWSERIARAFGQTAVLMMSLLLLPASKNSLWLKALGISWERSLWVHRWLGYAALVCMAGHFSSFWARFIEIATFPYDAFAYILYYPINSENLTRPEEPTYDNWTIPTQYLIAYPALFMIGISVVMRHKHWELFKYFHFVFLALIPAVLVHAASAWYFMLGGIAFWLVDASIRFACVVTPPARLLEGGIIIHEAEDGVTELRMNWTHAEPGQFAWLKVPFISAWEWHPFSLSSASYDGFAQMCIKNMGPGTFTDKLYLLGKQAIANSTTFDIQVDGPYGPNLDMADHGALLLIAGGIGITQVHSIFRTISQMTARGEFFPQLQSVQLVWIGRTTDLFHMLAESIKECVSHSKDRLQLSVTLYCTQKKQFDNATSLGLPASIQVLPGRPSFTDLYANCIQAAKGKTALVQACGPATMIEAAAQAARGSEQIVFESMLFVL